MPPKMVTKASIKQDNERAEELRLQEEKKNVLSSSGIETISSSLSEFLHSLSDKHLTNIFLTVASRAATKLQINKEDLIRIWNEVAPEYVINLEASVKGVEATTIPGKICSFYFVRSKKACDHEVSLKSSSGKYCSRHLKEENKPEKASKSTTPTAQCSYTNTKGEVGKQCTANVSVKSATGKYCAKHAKSAEKDPKTKKGEGKEEVEEVTFSPKYNKELKIYVDPATGYVINKDNRKIYARMRDGKLTDLSPEDITYLTEHEYEYDTKMPRSKPDEEDEIQDESEPEEDSDVECGGKCPEY
jgi:hypothetical protein